MLGTLPENRRQDGGVGEGSGEWKQITVFFDRLGATLIHISSIPFLIVMATAHYAASLAGVKMPHEAELVIAILFAVVLDATLVHSAILVGGVDVAESGKNREYGAYLAALVGAYAVPLLRMFILGGYAFVIQADSINSFLTVPQKAAVMGSVVPVLSLMVGFDFVNRSRGEAGSVVSNGPTEADRLLAEYKRALDFANKRLDELGANYAAGTEVLTQAVRQLNQKYKPTPQQVRVMELFDRGVISANAISKEIGVNRAAVTTDLEVLKATGLIRGEDHE